MIMCGMMMTIKRCSNCSNYPCDDSDAMSLRDNAESCEIYKSKDIDDREYYLENSDGDGVGYLCLKQSKYDFFYYVLDDTHTEMLSNKTEIPIQFLDDETWIDYIKNTINEKLKIDADKIDSQFINIKNELELDKWYLNREAIGELDVSDEIVSIKTTLTKTTSELIEIINKLPCMPIDLIERKHVIKEFVDEHCFSMSLGDIETFIYDTCKREFNIKRNADLDSIVKEMKDKDRENKKIIKKHLKLKTSGVVQPTYYKQWNEINIPNGYEIKNGKVNVIQFTEGESVLKPICNSPVVITKTGNNTDDDSFWVEVLFTDSFNQNHNIWVKQRDAFSRNGIMELVNSGLNVTEGKAHELNTFLSDLLSVNKNTLIKELVVSTNGWKKDESVFVSGECGYSTDEMCEVVHVDSNGFKGIDQKGDIQTWYDGLETMLEYDVIRFKMYSVMAAPLLRILNQSSCVVDDAKESSEGKTFGCSIAMSLIGSYKHLMINGDTTKTAAELKATQYNDHALFIDELGTQQNEEVLKALVYMIANEQGRGRANKDLTLRKTSTWKTIALTTGEAPITSHSSFTGQQVRVIEIKCGLPSGLGKEVDAGYKVIESNYGFIAPLFYQKMIENRTLLNTLFDESKALFSNVTTNTGKRLSNTFACINVAGIIFEEIFDDCGFKVCDPSTIVQNIFKESVLETPIENYSIRALSDIMDFIKRKESSFSINGEDAINKHEFYGWIVSDKIDIIPSVLRETLKRSDFDHTRVLDDWKEKDIVKLSPNRRDFSVSHDGQSKKVVRLNYDIIKNLL
jgi:uncharacterized protein (DUF927 family)